MLMPQNSKSYTKQFQHQRFDYPVIKLPLPIADGWRTVLVSPVSVGNRKRAIGNRQYLYSL